MVSKQVMEQIRSTFPLLQDSALLKEIETVGEYIELPEGEVLIDIGRYVKIIPLVLEGAIKILREDDDGNELFLYFLYQGQSCAMSINCCSANAPSEIRAITEEPTKLIAIPARLVEQWTNKYNAWKAFIFQTYSFRFNELLNTIDGIAFRKLDQRLMDYLRQKASITGQNEISMTHQKIACDLHSSREVISRLLKQLEKNGTIALSRNKITLLSKNLA